MQFQPTYNQVLPNLISDTFADFSLKINYKTLQAKWNLIKKYLMANKKLIEHSWWRNKYNLPGHSGWDRLHVNQSLTDDSGFGTHLQQKLAEGGFDMLSRVEFKGYIGSSPWETFTLSQFQRYWHIVINNHSYVILIHIQDRQLRLTHGSLLNWLTWIHEAGLDSSNRTKKMAVLSSQDEGRLDHLMLLICSALVFVMSVTWKQFKLKPIPLGWQNLKNKQFKSKILKDVIGKLK